MSLEARIAELNDTIKANTILQQRILDALGKPSAITEAATTTATTATKPKADKPATKPAAEVAVAAEVEPTTAAVAEVEPVAEVTETAPTVTVEDVKVVTIALGNANKRAEIAKLLEEYGAARATLIPEEFWADYVAKAKKALEA